MVCEIRRCGASLARPPRLGDSARRAQMPPSSPYQIPDVESALQGRFSIDRELRVGGQGVVYRARRLQAPDKSAAVDLVALKLHFDPSQDERAVREIAALEGLRHPNLADLIEHGELEISGNPIRFVAWEFIDGSPLDHRLMTGPLPPKTVAVIGRDIARAIDHIWDKRIVHRDVNPKNIMLRTGDRDAAL